MIFNPGCGRIPLGCGSAQFVITQANTQQTWGTILKWSMLVHQATIASNVTNFAEPRMHSVFIKLDISTDLWIVTFNKWSQNIN